MSRRSAKHTQFLRLLTFTFLFAFCLLSLILIYKAVQTTSTDIRSRAASAGTCQSSPSSPYSNTFCSAYTDPATCLGQPYCMWIGFKRILLMGDSMIGASSIPTILSSKLADNNIPADFVGDYTTAGNHIPADGFSGFHTYDMAKQLPLTEWTTFDGTHIPNHFLQNIPNVVVIQLGTNDAANAVSNNISPVGGYEKYMGQIVDYIRSNNPNIDIIIPMLIPSNNSQLDAEIQVLNAVIPGYAKSLNTSQYPNSKVVPSESVRSNWTNADLLSDGIHPSLSGQRKMVDAYYRALIFNHFLP